MPISRATYLEFIPIQMDVSTAIIREAAAPIKLKNLVAKIIALTIYPFLFIAAFEALVINGTKVLLNCVITLINTSHDYFFNEKMELMENDPSTPVTSSSNSSALITAPSRDVKMPSPSQSDREKIWDIVTKLAQANPVELAWNKKKLESYRVELKDLHPLQFLEAIFGPSSLVKNLMPKLMERATIPFLFDIPQEFLKGLSESMKNPKHKNIVASYIPSFAKKMKLSVEQVRACLYPRQNWRSLVNLLMEKHSNPKKLAAN